MFFDLGASKPLFGEVKSKRFPQIVGDITPVIEQIQVLAFI
jgi:hypothetical protein